MAIAIVTDSAADLSPEMKPDVTVVPLRILIGNMDFRDGLDITVADVMGHLRGKAPVSTSRPSPASFSQAYAELAREGYDCIISVHLSATLSGTYAAAKLAARTARQKVQVIDSRTLGFGQGELIWHLLTDIKSGRTGLQSVDRARQQAAGVRGHLVLPDAAKLQATGRLSLSASGAPGFRPLARIAIALSGGQLQQPLCLPPEVSTNDHLVSTIRRDFVGPCSLGVQHVDAPKEALALSLQISEQLGIPAPVCVSGSAVLAVHAGPGSLGVFMVPSLGP